MARVGVQVVGDAASAKAAFAETSAAAVKMGDDLVAVDSKIVESRARQIASIRENIAAYRQLEAAAVAGSDEQVAAASLAASKQVQLARLTRDSAAATREQTAASVEMGAKSGGVLSRLDGLTKALIAGFALKGAFNFAKGAVSGAATLQKSQEAIQAEFGANAKAVMAFGKSAASAFGLSANEADATSARFGILFNNMHFGTQRASEMTVGWEELAASMARIRGIDPTTMLNSIAVAAAGNTRGLKQLGIAVTPVQENMQALNDMFGTTYSKLSAAQRATVLYQLATQNLSRDLTLAKQHAGDLSNEQHTLSAEWTNAKDQLGQDLTPALQTLVHAVDDVMNAFNALPGPVRNDVVMLATVFAIGAPLLIGLAAVVKAVESIRAAFATVGPAAQTAAVEADTAMGEMGTAAEATTGEVAAVGGAFKTLGGLAAIAGLGFLDFSLGKKAVTVQGAGYAVAGANKSPYDKGTELDELYQAGLAGKTGTLNVGGGGSLNLSHLGPSERAAYEKGLAAADKSTPGGTNVFGSSFATSGVSALQAKAAKDHATVKKFLGDFFGAVDKAKRDLRAKIALDIAATRKKIQENQAKAQRLYAQGVSASGGQLKADAGASLAGGGTAAGGLTDTQKAAFDALIQFYKTESHDSKLTAVERARYHQDAVNAIKAEAAQSQKDALDYEKVAIDAAKARYDLVRRVKGDIDKKEAALRGEVRAYSAAAANKALSPADRAAFRTDAANARGQLAQLRNEFVLPMALQLAQARASSADWGRTSMGDVAIAERIKRYDEKLLQSHALSIQGQIAVYQSIAQQNQVLGSSLITGAAKAMSSDAMARKLGLHGAAKIAFEQTMSQWTAHAGHLPTGIGLQGIYAKLPPVHTHVVLNGKTIAHAVTTHQQKQRYRTAVQNSGPHAGKVMP